jgi:inositol-hexakisphosphate kinase
MDSPRPPSLLHFLPLASSSSLSNDRVTPLSNQGNEHVRDDVHYLSATPTLTDRKSSAVSRASTTIAESTSPSNFPPTSQTPMPSTTRHSFSQRTSTLLPYHSSSPVPIPRSRSRSSTDSSSSSGSQPQSSPQHGMGRKVAASLDLFRETTSADELDELDKPSIPLVASTSRRVSSKHHSQTTAEPEFSFFKRSEWPDRGTVAARREQSSGTRDRTGPRDASYPNPVSRDPSDAQRRKDRSHSVRENVMGELVNWRKDVLSDPYQDRGRPRKRSLDSNRDVDPVDHQTSHRNESSSFRLPSGFQFSPSSSHGSLSDVALTSPIVPSAIIADSPLSHQDLLPPSNAPNSPFTVEDEDEDSSNWDDESASDSGSTASTNSPWPHSPLQPNASLSPMLKQSVHHEDDEDEDAGLVMPSRVHPSTVPPELSDFPSYLSNFHDDDVQAEDEAAGHGPFSSSLGILANLSQESLPHIPLQPFRNQVGGHSAIYKFTKRAVCKVRRIFPPSLQPF